MLTVSEVMTRHPMTIAQTASVGAAVTAMLEMDVRHLPVINEDRELVGMVSDRDLRGLPYLSDAVNELTDRAVPLSAPVSSIMSTDVMSVGPDDDVLAVIEMILDARIGAVPVVTPKGRLIGIVSYVDLLRAFRRVLAEE